MRSPVRIWIAAPAQTALMGNRQGGFLHPSLCRLQQRKPGSPSQGSWRGAPEGPIKQQSRRPVDGLRLCCYGKEVKTNQQTKSNQPEPASPLEVSRLTACQAYVAFRLLLNFTSSITGVLRSSYSICAWKPLSFCCPEDCRSF